mmetsp:Transcript_5927/g.10662  ORF Transcript_5927/g.10662 Transcript_5927/m.10662 type:complete len:207 (+) Transcript_5927:819-1439(+)
MSVLLSNTITAAVPNAEFTSLSESKSISTSAQIGAGMMGTDEPPGITPSRLSQPPLTPPQCFSKSSRKGIDISSSTVVGLFTWPEIQNSFVPALFFRPKEANHSGPLRRIVGTTETVSTLVTVVGQPYKPMLAGKGGFRRGLPCFPSKLSISAVSSPQMYAPAPCDTYTSKSYPDPEAFLPMRPLAYASSTARSRALRSLMNSPRT